MSETCDTLDLIQKRRSIRKFSAEPVTVDQISTLAEAAEAAPAVQPAEAEAAPAPEVQESAS